MMSEFGIIKEKLNHGLFGVPLTWILEILPYLKKNGIRPNWIIDTYSYGPITPSIIKPKNVNAISNIDVKLSDLLKTNKYNYKNTECTMAHDLFFEYFDIPDDILQNVENIKNKFGKKTLGVHFRGTDKFKCEASFISKIDMIKNIMAFLSTHPEFDTIFIASDEEGFITNMKRNFADKPYILIFANAVRSKNNIPVHQNNSAFDRAPDTILLAKEAMIDSLTLSRCDYVIKTSSCLSDWVKIWNPQIEVYNLNLCRVPWFPHSVIPHKTYI
jgi:hydroxymethylpyrimidine pyrophosphatase-like HAD family hydrolase